jgi:chromosomal replication initiator protein
MEFYGSAGFERDADQISQPESYAARLVTYIRDNSTVRARVADRFGRSRLPSIERIAEIRSETIALREEIARRYDVDEPTEADEFDFCPTSEPFSVRTAVRRRRDQQARLEQLSRLHRAEEARARQIVTVANPRTMLENVIRFRGISRAILLSRSRFRKDVQNRTLAYALMRTCAVSWPVIGRMMGGRDHTTIMDGARVFFERDRHDPELSAAWEKLAPCIFRAVRTFEELQAMTAVDHG